MTFVLQFALTWCVVGMGAVVWAGLELAGGVGTEGRDAAMTSLVLVGGVLSILIAAASLREWRRRRRSSSPES